MDISEIQPINNQPALFIKSKKILVIADLHIGIEKFLSEQGINTPSQTSNMMKNIRTICKKHNPNELIILGDIKHNIPTSTYQERKDVKIFLEKISEFGKIQIIPGNHDGNIKKLCPEDIIVHPSSGFNIENIGFSHGHRWPSEDIMNSDLILFGHTHPTVMFTDRLGYKTYEPCWIKSNFLKEELKEKFPKSIAKEALVIPAFNSLCGGIAINKQGVVGPLGKLLNIENSQIYLVDGTSLGKVKNIY
jgi:putative SbcD/Mre11-related phosphoesterase